MKIMKIILIAIVALFSFNANSASEFSPSPTHTADEWLVILGIPNGQNGYLGAPPTKSYNDIDANTGAFAAYMKAHTPAPGALYSPVVSEWNGYYYQAFYTPMPNRAEVKKFCQKLNGSMAQLVQGKEQKTLRRYISPLAEVHNQYPYYTAFPLDVFTHGETETVPISYVYQCEGGNPLGLCSGSYYKWQDITPDPNNYLFGGTSIKAHAHRNPIEVYASSLTTNSILPLFVSKELRYDDPPLTYPQWQWRKTDVLGYYVTDPNNSTYDGVEYTPDVQFREYGDLHSLLTLPANPTPWVDATKFPQSPICSW
jgi:hypothetical protein